MATRLNKRSDGRYCKQITIGLKNGKPVKKSFYGKTIKEVEKKVRDFETLRDKGIILTQENITFEELAEMWIQNEKRYVLKPQSLGTLTSLVNIINSYIGTIKVKDLKQSHIEEMKSAIVAAGRTDQYNKVLATIRAILEYAITKDIIVRNITKGMRRIKYSGLREKRALTPEERKLVDTAELNAFEKCFLNLLLYTGLRRNEALALTTADINFKACYIDINKTLIATPTTTEVLQNNPKTESGVRKIPISVQLYPILSAFCKDKVGILFTSQSGGYIRTPLYTRKWKALIEKLREANGGELADDITAHIFRHTYASDLYKANVDIKTAQYLLGHTDIKTTLDIYTHFGYVDVKIDNLENYYKSVKNQSDTKIVPIISAK